MKLPITSFFKMMLFFVAVASLAAGGLNPLEEKAGVVPDEQTAIKLAETILFRHFGERQVKTEMPYKVKLEGGVWSIRGSLSGEFVGGVFYIDIRQKDACVLQLGYPE